MKCLLCILTLLTCTLFAKEPTPLRITHATTPSQLRWGLMARRTLAADEGLLLHYPTIKPVSLWAFNCFIDFDIAFLDQEGKIIEIGFLKSYPTMMEAHPPILTLQDVDAFSDHDPLIAFFRARALYSSHPVQYALELPSGFLQRHEIKIGDQVVWGSKDLLIIPFHN